MCVCICIYIYNGILLFKIKRKEILSFATTGRDLVGIMLNEISQTEKDKFFKNSHPRIYLLILERGAEGGRKGKREIGTLM